MPTLNLAQLKKRAKDLKNQARQEAAAALTRLRHAGIDTPGRDVKLTQAQHVVAREAGFSSWPKLNEALVVDIDTFEAAEKALVRAGIDGDEAIVDHVIDTHPRIIET